MDAGPGGGGPRRLRPVAPGVLVATSRRDRTSSVVLLGPDRTALLVDPAWTPDELDALAADLDVLRLRVAGVVSTHSHFDHLLWHPAFGDAPRWASPATAAAPRVAMQAELGTGYPRSAFLTAPPVRPFPHGAVPWAGTAVLPIVTGAHAPGHTSLWIPRGRILLAGDLLSDVEVPLLSEDDPTGAAYRAGLAVLQPYAVRAALVVPGHGTPGRDAAERLRRDRDWLDALTAGALPKDDPRMRSAVNQEAWMAALRARETATEDGTRR